MPIKYLEKFLIDTDETLFTGLVACYPFDGLNDVSGNNNNFTSNLNIVFDTQGVQNGMYARSELDVGRLQITGSISTSPVFSISFWVYMNSLSERGVFFFNGNFNSNGHVTFGVGGTNFDNNGNVFILEVDGNYKTFGTIGLGLHHFILQCDTGGIVSLWKDSIQASLSWTFPFLNITSQYTTAMNHAPNRTYPSRFGKISQLRFWNKILSANEKNDEWNGGAGNKILRCGGNDRLVVNLSKNNTYKDVVDIVEMKTGIFDKKTYIIKEIHNCLNELFSKKKDKHFYQWRKLFAITGSANPYTVDLSDTNPLPKQILMVKYFYGDSCENSQVVNLATPQELENISQLTSINSTSIYYNDRGDNLELYFGSSFTGMTDKAIEIHCVRQPNIEAVTLLNYSTTYVDALDSDVKELTEMVSERIM